MKRKGFVGREKRYRADRQLAQTETDRGLFRPRSTADCLRTFVLGRSPLLLIVVSFQSQLHRHGVGGGRVRTLKDGPCTAYAVKSRKRLYPLKVVFVGKPKAWEPVAALAATT